MKTILGWEIDSWRLIISLPTNKYHAWRVNIDEILLRGTTNAMASFYQDYTEHSRTKIRERNSREPSLPASLSK
jgi:hypothetical protein